MPSRLLGGLSPQEFLRRHWQKRPLFVPAALPWYYTWPLAVISALTQGRRSIAIIAGLSTWITVIWKPDGAHGMYSWPHVLLATACAAGAWYSLYKTPAVSTARPAEPSIS